MQADLAPLSPNTSALLAYLSSVSDQSIPQGNTLMGDAMSIQPSALWNNTAPINGVADNTPSSSSNAASVSPDALQALPVSDSDGEAPTGKGVARRKSSAGAHKRKAGHGHTVEELSDEDEDSGSDVSGHEDKRQSKSAGARRGRKSTDNAEGGKPGKEMSKAARRKEQNRAAQKAFRERREAKVKDLEDKVAELEGKAFSAGMENENLRGILKRLQEENVALKQSAFTFSMPVNNKSPSGTSTPLSNVNAAYRPQAAKPPSPPHSVDDSLRSINDPVIPRKSSGLNGASPESLVSVSSRSPDEAKAHPTFEQAFNNFAAGSAWNVNPTKTQNDQQTQQSFSDLLASLSRSNSSISPSSNASNNKSEIEALWASFYPNTSTTNNNAAAQSVPAPQPAPAQQKSVGPGPGQDTSNANSMFNFFAPQNFSSNNAVPNNIDKMAFRDPAAQAPAPAPALASPQEIDWSKFAENSDMDFLNSILGNNNNDSGAAAGGAPGSGSFSADDEFQKSLNALLQQSAGGSPSDAFALPNTGFSPSGYLNMSPSPLASISNSQSPASLLNSASQTGTPESSGSSMPSSSSEVFVAKQGNVDILRHAPGEIVHVVDETGKVLKPSELWVKMGMQHESNVDNLVIDDLCDQMRAKATCKDGQVTLNLSDATKMFQIRGNSWTKLPAEIAEENLRAMAARRS